MFGSRIKICIGEAISVSRICVVASLPFVLPFALRSVVSSGMPIGLRGGWRQRLEQARGSAAENVVSQPNGHLATRILQMWSWGQISAPAVQYICEGAILDGCEDAATKVLAKIGSGGLWQHNCQRDISRHFS